MAQRPRLPKLWHEDDFPLSQPDCSSYWWSRYPMSLQVQPSMKVEIRDADADLAEIVEQVLNLLCPEERGPVPLFNPQRALGLYRAIMHWKQSCPPRIRIEEAVLPSALLLQ